MKRLLSAILAIALTIALTALAVASNGEKVAAPSQTKLVLDGKEVSMSDAYVIEQSNYLQLRSVAQILSGTQSQFNVYWDAAFNYAVIETGKPYTGVKPVYEMPKNFKYYPEVPEIPDFASVTGVPEQAVLRFSDGYVWTYEYDDWTKMNQLVDKYAELLTSLGYERPEAGLYKKKNIAFNIFNTEEGYKRIDIYYTRTPMYYKDFPTVPDFGWYTGLSNEWTSAGGDSNYIYYYDGKSYKGTYPILCGQEKYSDYEAYFKATAIKSYTVYLMLLGFKPIDDIDIKGSFTNATEAWAYNNGKETVFVVLEEKSTRPGQNGASNVFIALSTDPLWNG
jgi:hypothetical protein